MSEDELSRRETLSSLGFLLAAAVVPERSQSVSTSSGESDPSPVVRIQESDVSADPEAEANRIRENAGIPDGQPTGARAEVAVGLSSDPPQSRRDPIKITSEVDIEAAADSGSGSADSPYTIRDAVFRGNGNDEFGVHWESDGEYHLTLENCLFAGQTSAAISMASPGRLRLDNCRFDSSPAVGIEQTGGSVSIHRCEFAVEEQPAVESHGDRLTVRDCQFTARGAETNPHVVALTDGVDADVRYATISGEAAAGIHTDGEAGVNFQNLEISGVGVGIKGINRLDATLKRGSEFKYLHIHDTQHENIEVMGADRGGYEISHSHFERDTGAGGGRGVLLNWDVEGYGPTGWTVHHCKFSFEGDDDSAGSEALESFFGKDVHFDHCWTVSAPEDAYEHAFPRHNVSVTNCVGDDIGVEMVDIFRSGAREERFGIGGILNGQFFNGDLVDLGPRPPSKPDRLFEFEFLDGRVDLVRRDYESVGIEIRNIHGNCGDNAVAISQALDIEIANIYVDVEGNATPVSIV